MIRRRVTTVQAAMCAAVLAAGTRAVAQPIFASPVTLDQALTPTVGLSPSGTAIAGFTSGGKTAVARSTDSGHTWSAPVVLGNVYSFFGKLVTDGLGNWVAVWSDSDGTMSFPPDDEILAARSTDDGATWSAPLFVNSDHASDVREDRRPVVATDGAGTWVAVWSEFGATPYLYAAQSLDGGATWSAPVVVAGTSVLTAGPALAADRSTGTFIATLALGSTIVQTRSIDGGLTWSAPATLGPGFLAPDIASDDAGTWVAIWLGDEETLASRSVDDGVTWSAPTVVAPSLLYARIAYDGAGSWMVVGHSRSVSISTGTDEDIAIAVSTDGGITFGTPSPVNTTAAGDADDDSGASLATDGAGGLVVVWFGIVPYEVFAAPMITLPGACAPAPIAGCRAPTTSRGAKLLIRDTPSNDRIAWTWTKGADTLLAEFGIPMLLDDYRLCIYDGGALVADSLAPADGTCLGKPCWRRSGTSRFGYQDGAGTPDGIDKISLGAGVAGKAKITARAHGSLLSVPALPLALPAIVQLQAAHGPCWEATFTSAGASANDPTRFSGRSD